MSNKEQKLAQELGLVMMESSWAIRSQHAQSVTEACQGTEPQL